VVVFEVETRSVHGTPTVDRSAASFTLVVEAKAAYIDFMSVRAQVRGDLSGDPPVSEAIEYEVELEGDPRLSAWTSSCGASMRSQ